MFLARGDLAKPRPPPRVCYVGLQEGALMSDIVKFAAVQIDPKITKNEVNLEKLLL